MKLPLTMEKRIRNCHTNITCSNVANSSDKTDFKINMNITVKEPLNTKSAVQFLIDGTLRLRVCRYCLNITQELSELDEILEIGIEESIHEVTIKDMVASFHPIKIPDDPNVPNKICNLCLTQAMKSYMFLQQCERAERALRNCFNDIYDKLLKLDPIEPVKKRGKRKLNPNPNIIHVDHHNVIDYAESIINLININSIPQDNTQMSELECKKCWQVLPNIESLVNHEKSHPSSMWYHCRLCGKSFSKLYQLKRHLRDKDMQNKDIITQATGIRCNTCGITSENLGKHLLHLEKHKFKVVLEHLIQKKMHRLCSVCLEESSNLVLLEEVIHLHGGYPGLTGDKPIYDIVSQTFPHCKSREKMLSTRPLQKENRCNILNDTYLPLTYIKDLHSKNILLDSELPLESYLSIKRFENGKITNTSTTEGCFENSNDTFLNIPTKVNNESATHDNQKVCKDDWTETVKSCKVCWIFKKPSCKFCQEKMKFMVSSNPTNVSNEFQATQYNIKYDWIFLKVYNSSFVTTS